MNFLAWLEELLNCQVFNTFIDTFYKYFSNQPIDFHYLKCLNIAQLWGNSIELKSTFSETVKYLQKNSDVEAFRDYFWHRSIDEKTFFAKTKGTRSSKKVCRKIKLYLCGGYFIFSILRVFKDTTPCPILVLLQFSTKTNVISPAALGSLFIKRCYSISMTDTGDVLTKEYLASSQVEQLVHHDRLGNMQMLVHKLSNLAEEPHKLEPLTAKAWLDTYNQNTLPL